MILNFDPPTSGMRCASRKLHAPGAPGGWRLPLPQLLVWPLTHPHIGSLLNGTWEFPLFYDPGRSPLSFGLRHPCGHLRGHMVCCKQNKLWERHLCIQSFLSGCLQSTVIPHRQEQSAAGDLKRDAGILDQGGHWREKKEWEKCRKDPRIQNIPCR